MTKEAILKDILAHFPRTTGTVDQIGDSASYLRLVTDHGKADRIGQYAMKMFPKRVYTYFVCHIFRRAHLMIYFKKG